MFLIARLEGQQPVLVLEQHHRLARRLPAPACGAAGESFSEKGIWLKGTAAGGSNIPSRNRAVKRRLRAVSISPSLISPSCTAFASVDVFVAAGRVRSGLDGQLPSHARCPA